MPKPANLNIRQVSKAYIVDGRPLPVLEGIDLTIPPGEFLSLVGASGCGKSTLLKLLAGLERDFEGELSLGEDRIIGPSLERGIVFQEPRLMPWLNVEDNIELGLLNAPISADEKRDRVAQHIALVRLGGFEKALPRQLSGGMAQRVAIARALVNRPNIILLDEPFGALDALTRAHLQDQLLEIWQRERLTAIFVTHDVEEALYLSDRVVVMAPRPGRVRRIVEVALPRPRDRAHPAFGALRTAVLSELTGTLGDPPPSTPLGLRLVERVSKSGSAG
jgi:ABC-type nitrate/sulfonate/bicarbonate transport system ATPase subunit